MKTSIFDMNFVLPPIVEMTEVMKDMPNVSLGISHTYCLGVICENCGQATAMKTSIFDMNFTLPPMVEMTEVVKDMPHVTFTPIVFMHGHCQETDMKTSIFNMNFTLPPMLEMTEVEKDLPLMTDYGWICGRHF